MCVEDISNEHTYGTTKGKDMPCKDAIGREETSTCRLIYTTEKTGSETDTDNEFAESVKTEFKRWCRLEITQNKSYSSDCDKPKVEITEYPYHSPTQCSYAEKDDDGIT